MTRAESVRALENLGYVVNLWHVSDVTDNYKCSESEASIIIDSVLDKLEEDIFERIEEEALDRGIDLHE
mgnify:CR=1 FL=1|jgi:hypothetical protein